PCDSGFLAPDPGSHQPPGNALFLVRNRRTPPALSPSSLGPAGIGGPVRDLPDRGLSFFSHLELPVLVPERAGKGPSVWGAFHGSPGLDSLFFVFYAPDKPKPLDGREDVGANNCG